LCERKRPAREEMGHEVSVESICKIKCRGRNLGEQAYLLVIWGYHTVCRIDGEQN
jgi:hypothetical protein